MATDYFDDDFVRTIERVPGVAEAEGRSIVGVRASQMTASRGSRLNLVGVEDFSQHHALTDCLLLDGARLSRALMEFLVSYNELSDTGLTVGETVQIRLPDDSMREMTVAGVVSDQSMAGDFAASAERRSSPSTRWMSWGCRISTTGSTRRSARTAATRTRSKSVAAAVEDKVEKSGRNVYNTIMVETDKHPMTSTILALLGVLGALGLLIMLLSGSLIFNTLNALLTQHMRQIGVMKLVGRAKRADFRHVHRAHHHLWADRPGDFRSDWGRWPAMACRHLSPIS